MAAADSAAPPVEPVVAGPGPGPGPSASRRRLAALVVLAAVLFGSLAGYAYASLPGPQFRSTSTVLFTAVGSEASGVSAGSRFVQERLDSWAAVAPSDVVLARADALSRAAGDAPLDPAEVSVASAALSGTEIVEITVTSTDAARAPGQATYVAQALADVVTANETYPGNLGSRTTGQVLSPGGPAQDFTSADGHWWAVIGGVAGFVVALLACSLLRPGPWARDVAPLRIDDRRSQNTLNARVMGDELTGLVRAGTGTPEGRLTVLLTVVAIAGYGVTAAAVFPLLPVLAAGIWGWCRRDARWSAAALAFTGTGVFPDKVSVVNLGPVTPTVLELALVLALVVCLRQREPVPRSPFTGPVLAVVAAMSIGAVVALSGEGEFASVVDTFRAMAMVLAFFPFYFAFARRPHQMVATLVMVAGVASAVVLLAAAAGWSQLLVNERDAVITGDATAAVTRLSGPSLNLWAPLLILLLSALVPRRPRWLWLALVAVGVLHQAASFTRSTWAPLILLIVVVAAITHGWRGVLRRSLGVLAVGVVGLALAFSGVLGAEGRAIAERATSVVTGMAYSEDSLPDRLRENAAATHTLHESPLLGVGMGQPYGGELSTYDDKHGRTVVRERPYIHNQYLAMWLWMGVAGLVAYAFVGVRILALTVHAWRRRAAGAPMVVAIGLGLSCLALTATLQTTLASRSSVLTVVALMAASAAFATWNPFARPPGPRVWAEPSRSGDGAEPDRSRRPAPRAGTLEE
jgi:O-antigen ligase